MVLLTVGLLLLLCGLIAVRLGLVRWHRAVCYVALCVDSWVLLRLFFLLRVAPLETPERIEVLNVADQCRLFEHR